MGRLSRPCLGPETRSVYWYDARANDKSIADVSVKDLRRWLAPPEHEPSYLMSVKDEISSKRIPGTCSWFKPRLQEFRDTTDQRFLLILGAPGSGKSALSGWILDEIESQENQSECIVLHFFISKNTLALKYGIPIKGSQKAMKSTNVPVSMC